MFQPLAFPFLRVLLPAALLAGLLTAAAAPAAPGDLDATFGDAGLALDTFGQGLDTARAAEVQADGKLVVAGYTEFPIQEIVVLRYDLDGSLDPTFGNGGEVRTSVPGFANGCQAHAVRIQPDGRIVVGGRAAGASVDFVVVRYATNGTLDPTFSGDGIATVDFGSSDECVALALQADGSIVAAGTSNSLFAVARLGSGGTLDPAFSGDGKATASLGTGNGRGVAIQSDGKIVGVGSGGGRFRLVRFHTNGTLDTTFDTDGLVNTLIAGSTSCEANAVAIQPAGGGNPERIVVAGRAVVGTGRMAVARYNLTGALDTTFDGDGMLTTAVGATNNAANAVLAHGTAITVAGFSDNGAFRNMAVVRYTSAGSLDATFDGDGILAIADVSLDDEVHGLALQGAKLVLAGYGWTSAENRDFQVRRLQADGSADATFDGDGLRTEDIGDLEVWIQDAAIQPDGKILVAGYLEGPTWPSWALARYSPDGTLDPTFGSGGQVVAVTGSFAYAMALQPDGKIVVAGTLVPGADDFCVGRFLADGSYDPTFGGNDVVVTSVGSGDDNAQAVALQPDGRILVLGSTHNGSNADIAVVRYLADGTLDPSFSGDGIATVTVGTGDDYGYDLEVLPDGRILVCGNALVGASMDVALVRLLANGSIDNAFGSFGRVATDLGGGSDDWGVAMVVQPDGKIVVAGGSGSPGYDFAVLRYTATGAPDTSFDGDGKTLTAFGLGDDFGLALALQTDGRIVAAGYTFLGADVDMAVARYETDGALDAGYGFGGRVAVNFDGGQDFCAAVCVDAQGRVVLAGPSADRCGVARLVGDGAVGVVALAPVLPEGSRIGGVAPNPAFGVQSLVLHVAAGEPLRELAVYDVAGRRVWAREVSRLAPGTHGIEWDGRAQDGRPVAPGVYFARLEGARAGGAARVVRIR